MSDFRLPEIDPEVADKLVSINEDLPTFSKITTEKIGIFMGKQIVDYECLVRNSDRKLEGEYGIFQLLLLS